MPGSLARSPQHEHRDKGEEKELTGELTEERGRRPWRRHRWHIHDCGRKATIQRLRQRGATSCSRPRGQAQHLGGDVGVAGYRPTDEATKGHRKHREAGAEAPARPAGADQVARARSTGRSSEAMATIGGEVNESPRSDGSTRRGGAIAP
jgi:hypothetical protein